MTSPPHPCHSSRVRAGALQSDDGASGRLEPQDRRRIFSGGKHHGVADGWSLYGGALADEHYQSAAMGVGRDLAQFGALAFDVTHSRQPGS
ncbi:MAG: fimbria/pilus outer membrane usher protein [Escherichia coli]